MPDKRNDTVSLTLHAPHLRLRRWIFYFFHLSEPFSGDGPSAFMLIFSSVTLPLFWQRVRGQVDKRDKVPSEWVFIHWKVNRISSGWCKQAEVTLFTVSLPHLANISTRQNCQAREDTDTQLSSPPQDYVAPEISEVWNCVLSIDICVRFCHNWPTLRELWPKKQLVFCRFDNFNSTESLSAILYRERLTNIDILLNKWKYSSNTMKKMAHLMYQGPVITLAKQTCNKSAQSKTSAHTHIDKTTSWFRAS